MAFIYRVVHLKGSRARPPTQVHLASHASEPSRPTELLSETTRHRLFPGFPCCRLDRTELRAEGRVRESSAGTCKLADIVMPFPRQMQRD